MPSVGRALGIRQLLLGCQHGLDVEEAEPRHRAGWPLDAIGIGDGPAEHLIAAAQAKHRSAAANVRGDVDVEAAFAQRRERRNRRLRARQDDEVDIAGQRRAGMNADQIDIRFRLQWIEIVEIGDLRQDRDGNLELRVLAPLPGMIQRQRILGRQMPRLGKIGNEPQRRPAGRLHDSLLAGDEQARIAAKLVDDETRDQRRILGIEHHFGADEARDHAATVDIADDDDRYVGGACKAHVGDVVAAQVHFRRAARAFDQHQIGFLLQPLIAFHHIGQELLLHAHVFDRFRRAMHLALHDDLRADLALRFQQDRDSCGRSAARRRRVPATPGRGRSRRRRMRPRRCLTCFAA